MGSGDVRYVVTVDDKGFTQKIETFDQAVAKLGKTARAAGSDAKSFGGELMGNLVPAFTAGTLAADIIRKTFRLGVNELKAWASAAVESERVDRSLESAIAIVGEAAGGTARKVKDYAAALMKQTVYDDEAIKGAQALIIQMRGTTAGLEAATKGAIGLASVFQMDLQSAARAVAQGLGGNYRQLGQMIPAIREATSEADKHAAMMDFFAGAYKRAQDEVGTLAGRVRDVKKSYQELQEQLGLFIYNNATVLGALAGVKEIITWIERESAKLEEKKALADVIIGNIPALIPILDTLRLATAQAVLKNKEFAQSWEGYTLGIMKASQHTALAAPVIKTTFVDLAKKAADAEKAFLSLTRQIQVSHSSAKAPDPLPFKQFGDTLKNDILYPLTQLPKSTRNWIDILKTIPGVTIAPIRQLKASLDQILDAARGVVSAFDAVFAQSQRNREIAIENEYKKRLAAINSNVKDETARQKAVIALEAEFQIKKTAAARASAKSSRAVSMMEAVVNTASAVTSALKVFPPWLGIAFASIVGALGAVQVALIAKQPIPLAKGGYFKRPTVLPGAGGRQYLLDEQLGNPGEIVSPVPMMRRIVREESGPRAINLGGVNIVIQAQTFDEQEVYRLAPLLARRIGRELELGVRY